MTRPVTLPNTFANLGGAQPAATLDANFVALATAINDPASYSNYAIDSGAVNTITVAYNPAVNALTAGLALSFKILLTNTGPATFNPNGLGAVSIVRPDGSALQTSDMIIGGVYTVLYNGTSWVLQNPSIQPRLMNDYISGFKLTNNGTTGFDVALGQAMDSTNVLVLSGAAIANKTQGAWVAGAAAGGKLSAAAMANNTWYYWYAIRKDADASLDYGFDVSSTTPTMPGGYTYFRYIGARKTVAAGTNWDVFIQHGETVLWSTPPVLDLNAAGTTANRTLTTMNVPAVRVEWIGNISAPGGAGGAQAVLLTDPLCADVAAAGVAGTTPLAQVAVSGAASTGVNGNTRCWTNTSSQIGVRVLSAAQAIQIATTGWNDPRGKPV